MIQIVKLSYDLLLSLFRNIVNNQIVELNYVIHNNSNNRIELRPTMIQIVELNYDLK